MTTPDTTDAARPSATAQYPGDAVRARTADSPLVRACREEPVPAHAGVVHAAGRPLAAGVPRRCARASAMLESCRRPDLVTEITLQPVRRHGVDAAIFFSDIVVPLAADRGRPRHRARASGRWSPSRSASRADLDAAARPRRPTTSRTSTEAVRLLVAELGDDPADRLRRRPVHPGVLPRRGRAVEEPRAHQGADVRRPGAVARAVRPAGRDHRRVPAGAGRGRGVRGAALRLVGRRARRGRLPALRAAALGRRARRRSPTSDVPRIHFGVGTGELLGAMGEAGADVVGVDWRVPLDDALAAVGAGYAVQGNLDPALLLRAVGGARAAGARGSLDEGGRRPGTSSTSATACCPTPTPTC